MHKLNIREARNALGQLDQLLTDNKEIIITKHGEAIARILPIRGSHKRPTHENLHKLTKKLSTPSEKMIRDERNER